MGVEAYISFKGDKQGTFRGNTRQNGTHPWKSSVLAAWFEFGVQTPVDFINGSYATGRRRHQPISIRKEVDPASPQLFQALVTNETLSSVIEITKAGKVGKPNYTLNLTGGHVLGIKHLPTTPKGTNHLQGHDKWEEEEISLTFREIVVTWNDGGIGMKDDWTSKT